MHQPLQCLLFILFMREDDFNRFFKWWKPQSRSRSYPRRSFPSLNSQNLLLYRWSNFLVTHSEKAWQCGACSMSHCIMGWHCWWVALTASKMTHLDRKAEWSLDCSRLSTAQFWQFTWCDLDMYAIIFDTLVDYLRLIVLTRCKWILRSWYYVTSTLLFFFYAYTS
jgi:hypothetical protein